MLSSDAGLLSSQHLESQNQQNRNPSRSRGNSGALDGALQRLAEACNSAGAVMHFVDGNQPRSVWSDELAEFVDIFVKEEWHLRNSRMERGMRLHSSGWLGAVTEQHAFSESELRRDRFQQEFARPLGFHSYAGAIVSNNLGAMVPISLERRFREGCFSAAELSSFNRLCSLLETACSFAVRHGNSVATSLLIPSVRTRDWPN